MSLLTQAYLLEKFGPLLTVEQLGAVLHLEPRTVANQISARTLGLPVIKRGKTPLFAAADVAGYLDTLPKVAA